MGPHCPRINDFLQDAQQMTGPERTGGKKPSSQIRELEPFFRATKTG